MPSKISKPGGEAPQRSESAASPSSQSAQVFKAQVLNVNTRDYTVDVVYESFPYSSHYDIPFMTPYTHQSQGEGLNFMPELGSTCWVCVPSESGRDAFVLGWMPVAEEGSYRAGRDLLNPGDIHFSTRDGNFLFLRRGGIVQVGSTPVCQRLYIPIRNVIRDLAENYELTTPAGDMNWTVLRAEDQGDGHVGTFFSLACHEYADDPITNPLALLKIGSHGEGDNTILSLVTRDRGGGSVKTRLTVSKSGSVDWQVQEDFTLDVTGTLTARIKQQMTVTATQSMSFETDQAFSAKGASALVQGGAAKLNLQGIAALDGSVVNLGQAMFPVMVAHPTMVAFINAVFALLSGPPSVPAMKGILPVPIFQSTKVKA